MDLLPPAGGDQNKGPELLAVTWIFTAIALFVVCLKAYTRINIIRDLGLDDFFVFLSMVLVFVCTSVISADVHAGMGRHAYYLTPEQRIRATKLNFIANPFGIMAYSLPNISVAIFLIRILNLPRWQRMGLYALVILQSTITGISCILLFTQCTPSSALWNPAVKGDCLPSSVITGYSYFTGSFSAFTDVFLAVVPVIAFWKLQMKLKTKIGLCLLMGMTSVAAICAIVKTTKLNELALLDDFTYATVDLLIWAVIEADVIIIAACIPSLKPLINSFGHSAKSSGSSRYPLRKASLPIQSEDKSNSYALNFSSHNTNSQTSSGVNDASFLNSSDQRTPFPTGIQRTTEVATHWEHV